MDSRQTSGTPAPNASVVLAVGATSTAQTMTGAMWISTVRIVASKDCFIEMGFNPVANATTSMFLPAGVPEYFKVPESGVSNTYKIAAIQATEAGSLYITPMA